MMSQLQGERSENFDTNHILDFQNQHFRNTLLLKILFCDWIQIWAHEISFWRIASLPKHLGEEFGEVSEDRAQPFFFFRENQYRRVLHAPIEKKLLHTAEKLI